jgi:PadR family transcriptional regulator, regulatory protein PadR
MRAERLKGNLELLLLATIAAEPAHGYRIVELLRERSAGAFDLAEGTVYPALYRLERAGLLASRWSKAEGRRRRTYRLTRRGQAALSAERREWDLFVRAVGRVAAAAEPA